MDLKHLVDLPDFNEAAPGAGILVGLSSCPWRARATRAIKQQPGPFRPGKGRDPDARDRMDGYTRLIHAGQILDHDAVAEHLDNPVADTAPT